jgi:hypothetical protein
MTRAGFVARTQAYGVWCRGSTFSCIAVLALTLASIFPLSKWLDGGHPPLSIKVVVCALVAFGLIVYPLIIWPWSLWRQVKKRGLFCPSCKGPLAGIPGQIAIASGRCGRCGVQLFQDNDEDRS